MLKYKHWQDNLGDMSDVQATIKLLAALCPSLTGKQIAQTLKMPESYLDGLMSRDPDDLMGDPNADIVALLPDLALHIRDIQTAKDRLENLLLLLTATEEEREMLLKLRHVKHVHEDVMEKVEQDIAITDHEIVPGIKSFMDNFVMHNCVPDAPYEMPEALPQPAMPDFVPGHIPTIPGVTPEQEVKP